MEEAIDLILNNMNDDEVDLEDKIRYFNGIADRFRKYMRTLQSKQVSKWEHAMERACDNIMGIGKTYTVARGSSKSVGVLTYRSKPLMWRNHVPSSKYQKGQKCYAKGIER